MTNDEYIAEAVNRHCFVGHDHIQLLSGRAKSCEKYPNRGTRRSTENDGTRSTADSRSSGGWADSGGLLSLLDNAGGDQEFRDRRTGLPLNPEMDKRARTLEMQHMEELKVLQIKGDACVAETGRPPIPTDWVDINKGDSLRPNHRSRLFCQETRERSTEDWTATFAATPPYEAFKLQLSSTMTGPRSQVEGDGDALMQLDISRAHLHSPLARAVFVTINGKVYKLFKAIKVSEMREQRLIGRCLM